MTYLSLAYSCSLKKEESQQKRLQEVSNQKAHLRIEELERAKQRLEQEVQANRRRLQLERLAAQQVTPQPHVGGWRGAGEWDSTSQRRPQAVSFLFPRMAVGVGVAVGASTPVAPSVDTAVTPQGSARGC